MSSRPRSVVRSVAILSLGVTLLAATGCDMVKAGARCSAKSGPGRDATHVLFCQKGRWTRVMTIGQAADFIISTWPTAVEVVEGGGGQTTAINSAFSPVAVRVTRKDGSVVAGADVTFSAPATGASLANNNTVVATDASGIARFTPVANGVLGGYGVAATVNGGYAPYVVFGLNNAAGAPVGISVVSGGGQSATAGTQFADAVVVKAVDSAGNTLTNVKIAFSTTAPGMWFGPAEAFAGENGLASTTIGTGNVSGRKTITATVVGTTVSSTFDLDVVAAAVNHANDSSAGDGQTANSASHPTDPLKVNSPLNVFLSDTFGNPAVGVPVQFVITPGTASGTFDATGTTSATILVGSNGAASAFLHSDGANGSFTVTATFDGQTHPYTFTVNSQA